MANQGNRDREGNLGQKNREGNNPTGTSGRGDMGGDAERNHQEGGDRNRRRQNADEDDESLRSRNTNR